MGCVAAQGIKIERSVGFGLSDCDKDLCHLSLFQILIFGFSAILCFTDELSGFPEIGPPMLCSLLILIMCTPKKGRLILRNPLMLSDTSACFDHGRDRDCKW